jgi:adenylate kinase
MWAPSASVSANEKIRMDLYAAQSASQIAVPSADRFQNQAAATKQTLCGILLFGPPGYGKGTVGKTIGKLAGFVHCSSGDLIRSAISKNGARGDSWSTTARGALIDDGVLWELFDSFLLSLKNEEQADGPLPLVIVDGIPRCRSQVYELAKRIDVRGVLCLECPDSQVLLDRLVMRSVTESRTDDASRITVENRLRLYEEQTLPLLEEYHPESFIASMRANSPQKC